MIIFGLDGVLADNSHRLHLLYPDLYEDICEKSNYKIINNEIVLDEDEKCKWRYTTSGEPFETGIKAYNAACVDDKVIKTASLLLSMIAGSDACPEIQIWSDRSESIRDKTMSWLDYHFSSLIKETCDGKYHITKVKMRPLNDHRPAWQIKRQWLNELAMKKSIDEELDIDNSIFKTCVDMVFESDPESIAMYRRRGVFVFDCRQDDETC